MDKSEIPSPNEVEVHTRGLLFLAQFIQPKIDRQGHFGRMPGARFVGLLAGIERMSQFLSSVRELVPRAGIDFGWIDIIVQILDGTLWGRLRKQLKTSFLNFL